MWERIEKELGEKGVQTARQHGFVYGFLTGPTESCPYSGQIFLFYCVNCMKRFDDFAPIELNHIPDPDLKQQMQSFWVRSLWNKVAVACPHFAAVTGAQIVQQIADFEIARAADMEQRERWELANKP